MVRQTSDERAAKADDGVDGIALIEKARR